MQLTLFSKEGIEEQPTAKYRNLSRRPNGLRISFLMPVGPKPALSRHWYTLSVESII